MVAGAAPTQPTESAAASAIALPPPWRIVLLVVALICGVIVVRNIFGAAYQVIGWAIAASLIAMLLSPVVRGMDRRMPRAVAIVVTFAMVAALGLGVTWLYSSTLLDQVELIQESGPSVAEEIEQRYDRSSMIGRFTSGPPFRSSSPSSASGSTASEVPRTDATSRCSASPLPTRCRRATTTSRPRSTMSRPNDPPSHRRVGT